MAFKDEINLESLIRGFVRLVVEFSILFLIYFWLLGVNTNLENNWLFFSFVFFVFMIAIPVQVQFEMLKKHGTTWLECFSHEPQAKLMKECEELLEDPKKVDSNHRKMRNVWIIALPYTLTAGIFGGGLILAYKALIGDVMWLQIVIAAIVAIFLLVPLILIINKKCLFPICYLLSSRQTLHGLKPKSVDDYYFSNHIIPWCLITLFTSALLAHKMASELLFSNGSLDLFSMAMYSGTTAYVTMIWMWHESKQQAIIEKQLNIYVEDDNDSLNNGEFIFLLHATAIVVIMLGFILGYVFFGDNSLGKIASIAYISLTATLAGAFGNILGVLSVGNASNADEDDLDPSDWI